jgi:hypothetical protein
MKKTKITMDNSRNPYFNKLLFTAIPLGAILLLVHNALFAGCTQVAMPGPLGVGLTYTNSSDPAILKLQNADGPSLIRYLPAGTQAGGTEYGPYTYEHGFIYMGRDDPTPYCCSTGMNDSGCANATQNWGGNGGPDNWNTKERAPAMGSNFEEYEDIIRAESFANTVILAGTNQYNVPQAAYILQGVTHIMGQNEPFFLEGYQSGYFRNEIDKMENWSRGDPSLLEIRDMAYILHLHNHEAQYMMVAVPKYRTIWLSCGYPAKSPLIPFLIDDPYIHPDFQDLTYYNSLDSNPYTLSEIVEIEDAIMAPDGSVIGDIRDIQMRIAKRLPIENPPNQRPVITSPDTINTFIDASITYVAEAFDPDDDSLSFEFLNVPDWLSNTDTTLSGTTPDQMLDTSFSVIASDGNLSDTLDVIILVDTNPLSIFSKDLREAVYKNEYSDTLAASGGLPPYAWTLIGGNLVSGIEFSVSGIISGQPVSSGLYHFVVQVYDSSNPPKMDTLSFDLNVINHSPRINSGGSISAEINKMLVYYADAIDPDGNELIYEYSNYPSWLLVADSLILGVVPRSAADTSFSLMVSDGELKDSLEIKIIVQGASSANSLSIPTHFKFYNNFPNPFNDMTHIKIDLPESGHVKLLLYDLNGRLIDEIYNEKLGAGEYMMTWDANRLSSGIYFLRCKTNKYDEIIKCTLLK